MTVICDATWSLRDNIVQDAQVTTQKQTSSVSEDVYLTREELFVVQKGNIISSEQANRNAESTSVKNLINFYTLVW